MKKNCCACVRQSWMNVLRVSLSLLMSTPDKVSSCCARVPTWSRFTAESVGGTSM